MTKRSNAGATMLVRIKPYNPKQDCVVRRFVVGGVRYEEARGWYRVPAALAERLREIPQRDTAPWGQKLFDVMSEADAAEMEQREQEARLRASTRLPHDLSGGVVDGVPVRRHRPSGPPRKAPPPVGVVTTADLPENVPSDVSEPENAPGLTDEDLADGFGDEDLADTAPAKPPLKGRRKR